MGSPRRRQARAPVFGDTTDYVLKHAPCRVMVVGARAAA
jgi:nucleotide-binding universal stress UspA family protein